MIILALFSPAPSPMVLQASSTDQGDQYDEPTPLFPPEDASRAAMTRFWPVRKAIFTAIHEAHASAAPASSTSADDMHTIHLPPLPHPMVVTEAILLLLPAVWRREWMSFNASILGEDEDDEDDEDEDGEPHCSVDLI
jgi:hypothetical protein